MFTRYIYHSLKDVRLFMSYKGWFTPKNPLKYKGDSKNVVYRSSWELKVMKWLDANPAVLWWASEELIIKYRSPIDQKIGRAHV